MGTNPTIPKAIREISLALARHRDDNRGKPLHADSVTKLTDEQAILRTAPEKELIAWLEWALKQPAPAVIRQSWVRALGYLNALAERQAEAWPKMLAQYDREDVIVGAMILHLEHGIGTKERFEELQKELFAMYENNPFV